MIDLPVDAVIDELKAALDRGNVVLQAPPGSGKTTRVPPALMGRPGKVLVLEPRRIAARAAARRVADEQGWTVGEEVGWQVRFDNRTTAATRLIFMTEGVLLRRIAADPFLEGVHTVVLDEFHERSVAADLAIALCRTIQREARDDLRVVAMSATLEAGPVAEFLEAERLSTEATLHPVELRYDPRPDPRPLELRVRDAVLEACSRGDVLAFLPGRASIERCAEALGSSPITVVPLHGSLSSDQQDQALCVGSSRRVVLATNVAESSLTVPGVHAVVDTGLAKVARIDPATGLDRLDLLPIARDAAEQRAGRAGRLGPGLCRRLWTALDHRDRPAHTEPAIHRIDLAPAALALLDFGEDPRSFSWFDPPRPHAVRDALLLLERLGAHDGGLTATGRRMARMPLHPRLARFLLEADRYGAGARAADLVAWLSDGGRPRGELVDAAPPASRAGRRLARSLRGGSSDPDAIERAALAAWPDRLARTRGEGAVMVGGTGLVGGTHELFVALGVNPARKTARGEWKVELQSRVEASWLEVRAVHLARFDPEGERVVGVEQKRAGLLVLDERVGRRPDPERTAAMLYEAAMDRWLKVWPDDKELDRLVARMAFLGRVHPVPGLPDGSPSSLGPVLEALCRGRSSFAALRKAPWRRTLLDHLPYRARQALDRLAPERIAVASGRQLRLQYPSQGPPVLAARMQHLFGTHTTPRVAGEPVLVHLLAPNGRPQQVTRDLENFWASTWHDIRKELAGRYPKHPWPKDPK